MLKNKILLNTILVLLIIIIMWAYFDYDINSYLFSWDFRFHIDTKYIWEHFIHFFNYRFSNNNFIFLSFNALYHFKSLIWYQASLLFILCFPIVTFFSLKNMLLYFYYKYNHKSINDANYFFILALAFIFAINASFFDRFGHLTIVFWLAVLPFYIKYIDKYISHTSILSIDFLIAFFLLRFWSCWPHMIIVYFWFTVILFLHHLEAKNYKNYIIKWCIFLLCIWIVMSPTILAVILWLWQSSSIQENPISASILSSLSKHNNILSILSWTSYYYKLVQYFMIWPTFFVFILYLYLSLNQPKKTNDTILHVSIILWIVLIWWYTMNSRIYDLILQTKISSYMRVIKDPNMYYMPVFLIILIYIIKNISFLIWRIKDKFIIILASFLIFANVLLLIIPSKEQYKKFYGFVDIPPYYNTLADFLDIDHEYRNFWLPYNRYYQRFFSQNIEYFPSPFFRLTKNKELTDSTIPYKNLINIIQSEIYDNKCKNKYFLSRIIAIHKLNIVVDTNIINNTLLSVYDIEDKVKESKACIDNLPKIQNIYKNNGIYVYRSVAQISSNLYYYKWNIETLDAIFQHEPIYNNTIIDIYTWYHAIEDTLYYQILSTWYTVLQESYDQNRIGNVEHYNVNLWANLFLWTWLHIYYKWVKEIDFVIYIVKIFMFLVILIITSYYVTKK